MDAIALHQAGYDNAVAALGTAFTRYHALLLKEVTDVVYLCFDSDAAGTIAKKKSYSNSCRCRIKGKSFKLFTT